MSIFFSNRILSSLGFTGIDAPYQEPEHPDVIVDTNVTSIDRSIVMITEKLAEHVSEYLLIVNEGSMFI